MTDAQRQIQVGQMVRMKGSTSDWKVRHVYDDGVTVTSDTDMNWIRLHFFRWSEVILPEPPKAKPGVVYRSKNDWRYKAIGRLDGRLVSINPYDSDFGLPSEWEEDPVQP